MDINQERLFRLLDKNKNFEDMKSDLYEFIKKETKLILSSGLRNFVDLAADLGCSHPGLSAEQYFGHPVRVAKLSLSQYRGEYREAVFKLALVHNLIEVSDRSEHELRRNLGDDLYYAIEHLTVDRSLRWNSEYLLKYYDNLHNLSCEIKLVKVCDKIDNIFLLEDNPCSDTKFKYLEEVDYYVVPLAKTVSRHLSRYLELLSVQVRKRINS